MRYPKLREQVRIGGVTFDLRVVTVLWTTTIVTMIYYYHGNFLFSWLRQFGPEREPDELVYALYGLTPEEITLVECAAK